MAVKLLDRIRAAVDVFRTGYGNDYAIYTNIGPGTSTAPHNPVIRSGTERSIINAVYTRIATDSAGYYYRHVRVDENNKFVGTVDSYLNHALSVSANKDQTARAFIQDVVETMFEDGKVAIVPAEATKDIRENESFDIFSLRSGKIVTWYPDHVKINLYNDKTGMREDILLPKRAVGIIQNPFFSVMNAPNSTFQRLVAKLNLLDAIDKQSGSGKMDIVIRLPYRVNDADQRKLAEERRKLFEDQMKDSQYGIAYIDGAEQITQLNRPVENNLMAQVEYLTKMLYSQLGVSPAVFEGTASEEEMLNYYNRTISPIVSTLTEEMKRKFLTKTAITQGQSIAASRDVFSFMTVAQLAEIADKFTRNEIATSNEIRGFIGMMPSRDPNADVLRNKNLNPATGSDPQPAVPKPQPKEGE